MPIQLAGNVRYGGLFEAGFGVTLGELVDDIGGGTLSGRPVRAVQVGGPLGAYFPPGLFDTHYDYEAFTARGGLIGHARASPTHERHARTRQCTHDGGETRRPRFLIRGCGSDAAFPRAGYRQ